MESYTFLAIWGEFGPTFEDVLNLMALPRMERRARWAYHSEKRNYYWSFQDHVFKQIHICIVICYFDEGEESHSGLIVLEGLLTY